MIRRRPHSIAPRIDVAENKVNRGHPSWPVERCPRVQCAPDCVSASIGRHAPPLGQKTTSELFSQRRRQRRAPSGSENIPDCPPSTVSSRTDWPLSTPAVFALLPTRLGARSRTRLQRMTHRRLTSEIRHQMRHQYHQSVAAGGSPPGGGGRVRLTSPSLAGR